MKESVYSSTGPRDYENMHEVNLPSYQSARFLTSAETLAQCPPEGGAEIAFAGRSNAGKSSAINALTGNGGLARTSRTPGRTRLINFFSLNKPDCRLVDLPGYGYARVSREMQEAWQEELHHYLENRLSLRALILVTDIRHPLNPLDSQMMDWCRARRLPALILLTKADKLSRGAAHKTLREVQNRIVRDAGLFACQIFSATAKTGIDEARAYMDRHFAPVGGLAVETEHAPE